MKKVLKELQEIKKLLQIIVSNQEQVENRKLDFNRPISMNIDSLKKEIHSELPKSYSFQNRKENVSVIVGEDSGTILIQKAGVIECYRVLPN